MACLRDILGLFCGKENPFYAGFGNRLTDALSYRSVNIPSTRIFTINSNAEVSLDLLSLNKYKSSYVTMQELLDHFFPPTSLLVQSGGEEYTDFTYWRDTPQELEDFSATDSEDEDEEEPAEDDVLEDEEEAEEEDYEDELSDGEGSEYLDETALEGDGGEGADMGASFMSQASAPLSNPAGSIVESVEGDQNIDEDLAGEEAGNEPAGASIKGPGPIKPITLPIRPKATQDASTQPSSI